MCKIARSSKTEDGSSEDFKPMGMFSSDICLRFFRPESVKKQWIIDLVKNTSVNF
jgi:hypothetical protein